MEEKDVRHHLYNAVSVASYALTKFNCPKSRKAMDDLRAALKEELGQ